MKLLLDENLSRRLVAAPQEAFAGTQHVANLGLQGKPDTLIWSTAQQEAFQRIAQQIVGMMEAPW